VNSNQKEPKQGKSFVKYSGIGMQLLFTIGLGVWLGMKLDTYMGNKQPWGAISLSMLFLIAALYNFIRSVTQDQNE
jgi:ATP synthase protein I